MSEPAPVRWDRLLGKVVLFGLPALAVSCVCSAVLPFQPLFFLAFGWVPFLTRNAEKLATAPGHAATFGVGIGLATVLCHALCRSWQPAWSWFATLRAVGVVLALIVAGVAMICVVHQAGWLATSGAVIEPGGLRAMAARIQSQNNLREQGVALHNHNDGLDSLPAGCLTGPTGEPLLGWPVPLLPFLEHENLYRRIDRTKPWDDKANADVFANELRLFQHPGASIDRRDGWPVNHYAANVHVFGGRPLRLNDVTAGTSNVVGLAEAAGDFRPWGHPLQWRDPLAPVGRPDAFGSPVGSSRFNVLMLDGSVRTFNAATDADEFRSMSRPRR